MNTYKNSKNLGKPGRKGIAKAINKPQKSRISSPTLALMAENGDNKQRIEYAEICSKTIKTKARIYNQEIIRETIMASKSLKKVRRTQKLGQDRLITLLDMHGREIHDQDKIIERIEDFYTEIYDNEQSTIIHTDPNDVPEITSREVEAALRDMKNGTATGNDHINIDILKAGEDIISKTLAKLYTRRKPATRASWIQKRILNDRPHPRRKPAEGEVQRIYYSTLHRIRRLREMLHE